MLEVRNLTFAYHRRQAPVIEDLSVAFEPGTLTALTGPSGSGKSTLLYIAALMLRASTGEVWWNGHSVAQLGDAQRTQLRAQEMGFVFQDALLDPARTIRDNICEPAIFAGIPMRAAQERAQELMERFGVNHRARHKPGEISGGQAQRVALCRALMTRPRIVFGDEPTGNLDHASANVVWQALAAHADEGATVIVATHDEGFAAQADRVVTLA